MLRLPPFVITSVEKKIMIFFVATNIVASRPPERQPLVPIFEYCLPPDVCGHNLTSCVLPNQTVKLKLFSTASIMRDNLSFRRSSYTYNRANRRGGSGSWSGARIVPLQDGAEGVGGALE